MLRFVLVFLLSVWVVFLICLLFIILTTTWCELFITLTVNQLTMSSSFFDKRDVFFKNINLGSSKLCCHVGGPFLKLAMIVNILFKVKGIASRNEVILLRPNFIMKLYEIGMWNKYSYLLVTWPASPQTFDSKPCGHLGSVSVQVRCDLCICVFLFLFGCRISSFFFFSSVVAS